MRYRIITIRRPLGFRGTRWGPPFFDPLRVCSLVPCGQGVDTTTPAGKALFQMMGLFAEFERAMRRERVCVGLGKARARGRRLGRPQVAPAVEDAIRTARAAGRGQLAIARELGVGVSTVRRVLGAGTGPL